MWTIRKILVPTDFSEGADAAVEAALELAAKYGASVLFFHSYPLPVYSFGAAPMVPLPEIGQAFEEAAQAGMKSLLDKHAGSGIVVESMVRCGTPWEQILEQARASSVGLIVMGTHGRSGLPRVLLGSVAERTVRLSPVPVLTIRTALTAKTA